MTNSDYILKSLSVFGVTGDTVEVILLEGGLNGSSDCDIDECKKAVKSGFHHVRAAAHRIVSEGGFSLSFNDCEKALKAFERSLGTDGDGKIGGCGCIDKSHLW